MTKWGVQTSQPITAVAATKTAANKTAPAGAVAATKAAANKTAPAGAVAATKLRAPGAPVAVAAPVSVGALVAAAQLPSPAPAAATAGAAAHTWAAVAQTPPTPVARSRQVINKPKAKAPKITPARGTTGTTTGTGNGGALFTAHKAPFPRAGKWTVAGLTAGQRGKFKKSAGPPAPPTKTLGAVPVSPLAANRFFGLTIEDAAEAVPATPATQTKLATPAKPAKALAVTQQGEPCDAPDVEPAAIRRLVQTADGQTKNLPLPTVRRRGWGGELPPRRP